jgi:lipopolysaccharide transport system permease protein
MPAMSGWVFLVPLLIVHVACIGLGVGLIISAVTAKYRDLHHLTGMLIQLWMYATPVIYPLSRIPEKWRWVAGINPMTAVVEAMRQAFLSAGHITIPAYLTSLGLSVGLLLFGVLLYQRMVRTFVDTV